MDYPKIESYRRQLFLEDANRAFATLRNDSAAWEEEREEREAWLGIAL